MGRKLGSKNKTVSKSVNKNKNVININVNSTTTKRKKKSGNSKNVTNNSVGRPAGGGGGITSNYGRQSVQPFIVPATIPQQVQPQSIGDSTALNMLMSSIMQRDNSQLTPQHTPQSRKEIQTVDTANTIHETSTIKPPKPRAIKNIVDEIQPVIEPEIETAIKLPPTRLNFNTPKEKLTDQPKTSMLKRLFGLGRKKNNKIEMSPFQQDTPSKEEIKLLEYKEKPIISSSQPPTPKMSEVIFGPAKVRQAATAPTAISTQTSEVQTEKFTQAAIDSDIKSKIKEISVKSENIQLGMGPFKKKLKPKLAALGIPSNMRDPYYTLGYQTYKEMLGGRNIDIKHNSGMVII